MLERGRGRIVMTGSGAALPPGREQHRLHGEQGGRGPLGETLARSRGHTSPRLPDQPGPRRTGMTSGSFDDDAPWTPPELAPRLVRVLASGRADALAGRYIHAEHDDIEDLIARADKIRENDLNAIRLRR